LPKILLVARFDDALHSHAALHQRALERWGHTVTPFNLERTGWLGRLTAKDLNSRLENALGHADPDLVLLTDGEVLREGAVEPSKRHSRAKWVHWFPHPGHDGVHIAHALRVSDHVFVAGRAMAAQAGNAASVHVLDQACDPSIHRPLRVREPFRANVVFAGTASPYREATLGQLVEFGLAVWGPGWKKTRLKEYCRGELLSAENYVRAYAGATVAVNIHREPEGPEPDGACNARLFEIAAMGVMQVVDRRRELGSHFTIDEEILTHGGVEELRDKVRQALTDVSLRDRLAAAARQTALKRHTYMHRMKHLLDTVGLSKGRA
jgi:hypothetical protein